MSDLAGIIQNQPDPVQNYLKNYYGVQQIQQGQADREQRLAQQKLYMTFSGLREVRAQEAAKAKEQKDQYSEETANRQKAASAFKDGLKGFYRMNKRVPTEQEMQAIWAGVGSMAGPGFLDSNPDPGPYGPVALQNAQAEIQAETQKNAANKQHVTLKSYDPQTKTYYEQLAVFNPDAPPESAYTPVGEKTPVREVQTPQPQVPHFNTWQGTDGKMYRTNTLTGETTEAKAPGMNLKEPPSKELSLKDKLSLLEEPLSSTGYVSMKDGREISKVEAIKEAAAMDTGALSSEGGTAPTVQRYDYVPGKGLVPK